MARYFAYYVNGGYLHCNFSLDNLVDKFENVQNDLNNEILLLLD